MNDVTPRGRSLDFARAYGQIRWVFLPTDPRAFRIVRSKEFAEQLFALAARLELDAGGDVHTIQETVRTLEDREEFEVAYHNTFRGAMVVSPFEADYTSHGPFEMANELADVAGFYRAFGFGPSSATIDRVDHIAGELEFLCVASWKHDEALAGRRLDDAEVVDKALADFLVDHAGRWFSRFASRCAERGAHPLFLSAAHLAAALVEKDLSDRGLKPKPVSDLMLPLFDGAEGQHA